jgi:hypothetical protein
MGGGRTYGAIAGEEWANRKPERSSHQMTQTHPLEVWKNGILRTDMEAELIERVISCCNQPYHEVIIRARILEVDGTQSTIELKGHPYNHHVGESED